MSVGRFLSALLALFLVLLLSACTGMAALDDFDAAVRDGIIAPAGQIEAGDLVSRYVTVTRGDIERTSVIVISAEFPVTRALTFERSGGVYSGAYFEVYARVAPGDLLGEQFFHEGAHPGSGFQGRGLTEIERDRLTSAMERFEARFARDYAYHRLGLEDALLAAELAESDEFLLRYLQLAQRRVLFEQFLFDGENTRRYYEQQLAGMDEIFRTEQIRAPFGGVLTAVSGISSGTEVSPGHVFFTVADTDYFQFRVSAPAGILRFGSVITLYIQEGEFSFDTKVISDVFTAGTRLPVMTFVLKPADKATILEMLTHMDMSVTDMAGMTLRAVFTETLAGDVLTLPAQAIRQENHRNYILLYYEGRLLRRYVSLGIRTPEYVQVLMGAEEGQRVVLP